MSRSLLNIATLLVLSVLFPMVIGGDMSLLCTEDKPIDAVFKYKDVTFVIKNSNVWRYSKKYIGPDMVDGPIPLSKIFTDQKLDAIDAVFHINAEPSITSDPKWRAMCTLAIVFRKSRYYIFRVQQDGDYFNYYYHNYSDGVPLGLPFGSEQLKYFKDADQLPVDAALFNRAKSEAMITAETNVYILSGFTKDEAFNGKSKKPVKKKMNAIFKQSEKINAAMDMNTVGSVMLVFDKEYCEVNISNPMCRKKSITKDWFRCDQISRKSGSGTEEETIDREDAAVDSQNLTATSDNDNSPDSDDTETTVTSTKKTIKPKSSKKGDNDNTIIIIAAIVAVIIIIIIIAVLVMCFMKGSKKSEAVSAKGSGASGQPKSARSGASRASQKTTFSTAFGPSK